MPCPTSRLLSGSPNPTSYVSDLPHQWFPSHSFDPTPPLTPLVRLLTAPAVALVSRLPVDWWPLWIPEVISRSLPEPTGIRVDRVQLGHCGAEWVTRSGATSALAESGVTAVLYLHGGAFLFCGPGTHRNLTAHLARELDAPVLSVDYRMLPKHSIADAISDCLAAYRYLLACGHDPERIVVAGDSAGGYLTLATAQAIRDADLPRPAALVAISPLTRTVEHAHRELHPNARRDPLFSPAMLRAFAHLLVRSARESLDRGQTLPVDPAIADLTGLPPTLIQVGSTELLLDDAEALTANLLRHQVPVQLQVWENQLHIFPIAAGYRVDSDRAVAEIGTFVRGVLGKNTESIHISG